MKTMMTKLAASVSRMRMAIGHMFDAYEQALNELIGTPAYPQLFETCEMM